MIAFNLLKQKLNDHGIKQLACIEALEKKYSSVDMSAISLTSKFSDSIWIPKDFTEPQLDWEKLFSESEYPLMILCKIAIYRYITIQRRASSSIQYVRSFTTLLKQTLAAKNILCLGGDTIIPLSNLVASDIHLAVTNKFIETNSRCEIAGLVFLSVIAKLPDEAVDLAPILSHRPELPWEDTSVHQWFESLAASLGIYSSYTPYQPLNFEQLSLLIQEIKLWLTKDRIDVVTDIFKIFREGQEDTSKKYSNVSNKKITDEIIRKHEDKLKKIYPFEVVDEVISTRWFASLFNHLRGLCCIAILLTTGIRNVDLRKLVQGCCVPSKRTDLLYYLVLDIKKTKNRQHIIPVPELTFNAIQLLEGIRTDQSSEYIVSKFMAQSTLLKGRRTKEDIWALADSKGVSKLIKTFFKNNNIPIQINDDDDEATAHCFRTTLAGWIGQNSNMATMILKRLFGHSNSMMPDAYLRHNPFVQKRRQESLLSNQKQVASQISKAISSNKVAGSKSESMRSGASDMYKEFQSKIDSTISFEEYLAEKLFERIETEQIYAMFTPMSVICIRNSIDTSEAPCARTKYRQMREDKEFSQAISNVLGLLPNPKECVGIACKDALVGDWSLPLYETYQFYKSYLSNTDTNADLANEAEIFIKQYGEALIKVFEDINDA